MLHDFLKLGLKCAKLAAFPTSIVGGHQIGDYPGLKVRNISKSE